MMNEARAIEPARPAHDVVLVTGAAGFIGSRATAMLARSGVHVIALDNLYVGLPLPESSEHVLPVKLDIRDRDGMAALMATHRPDAVMHLAAVHHIPTCERDPALAFDVNVMGTQSVLDAAHAAGTRDVLLASSGAVYDWLDGPLDETATPLRAKDVYSITKLANEQQVIGWAERTGSRAHVARLFNVIGTGDPNGHLIPDIMAQIGDGASARVRLGNTAPRRDYIHVDDVASGLVTMLGGMVGGADTDIFNLCSGADLSVAELVGLMGDIMGVQVTIQSDPARIRKVDRLSQLGLPAKMAERYGWRAQWTTRAALAQIIDAAHAPVPVAA